MKSLLILLLFLLYPLSSFAEENSCKVDVYFANGIKTNDGNATANTILLKRSIQKDIYQLNSSEYEKQIGKVERAYNNTYGFGWDGIETFLQKFGWQSLADKLFNASHGVDLSKQINAYKASINARHKVLAVAHSQGNLFTKEAYDALSSSMRESFEAVSIASPMSADIKPNTTRINLDNDIVPRIARLGASSADDVQNNVRAVKWYKPYDPTTTDHGGDEPSSGYTYMGQLGKVKDGFTAEDAGIDLASKVHAFTFYMGQALGIDDGNAIPNMFTGSVLVNNNTKNYIMNEISKKLEILGQCEDKCHDEKNSVQPESGIIGISLNWSNPEINMSLSSAIGTKDISATECNPSEHYYVKSEDDVTPGIYAVSVNHSGSVDNNLSSEKISLNIHTPDAAMVFDFDITSEDMLDIGHVADIIITEEGDPEISLASGGGGGSPKISCYGECTGVPSDLIDGPYNQFIYKVRSKLKQALLGPLGNAEVSLRDARDFKNKTAFYESSTNGGNSLLTTGIFYFPSEILSSLEEDSYYVQIVHGGYDIDVNDDGKVDAIATKNLGTIHAVVRGNSLKKENNKVNILTEIAYVLTKDMMTNDLNTTQLENTLDEIAVKLLRKDQDDSITYQDLLSWDPMSDKDKLIKKYSKLYEPMVSKIYKGEDIYNEAYEIVYGPTLSDYSLTYVENSPLESFSHTIDIGLDNKDVVYNLSGKGSELFEISESGVVTLKHDAVIDYEIKQTYSLALSATVNGMTTSSKFVFKVENVLDNPELEGFNGIVEENSLPGVIVGTVKYIEGTSPISQFSIFGTGSENFEIDENGVIRIRAKVKLDYESIKAFAFNVNAVNDAGKSLSKIVYISLLDLPDTPILSNYIGSIDENSTKGTTVGYIEIQSDGGTDITNITLRNEGSHNFSVTKEGEIKLSEYSKLDFETVSSYLLKAVATNLDEQKSTEVDVVININNIIEPPVLHETTFIVDEHVLGGTLLGKINMLDSIHCSITSMNLENLYPMGGEFRNHFMINNQGLVSVALDAIVDYEKITKHSGHYRYDVKVQTVCGDTSANLNIYINNRDEDAKIGIGTASGVNIFIYEIEQNGTISPYYKFYENSNYMGIFNNHKYELDSNKYYLFSGFWGEELDANYDGIVDDSSTEFEGPLRAIVKGEWLHQIEMLKVSPMTEMIVREIEHQVEGFTPSSLDVRMFEAAKSIVKSDIDANGSINVYDSLVYSAQDVYDSYIFVSNFFSQETIGDLVGDSIIGKVQVISIHGGLLKSMVLFGKGSEYFSLDNEGVLRAKSTLSSRDAQTYSFFLKAIDTNGLESVSKIEVRISPPMF